jgi:hypothetical protein
MCVLLTLLLLSAAQPTAGAPPRVAIEAGFKNRITPKILESTEAAATHLVNRLQSGPAGVFGGYEVGMDTGDWTHECTRIDASRDGFGDCAARQLQALASLCQIEGFVELNEEVQQMVKGHLKALAQKQVPPLGLKTMQMGGATVWLHQKSKDGDNVDSSPVVQAAVLYAMTVCANATKQTHYFQEAESMFMGLTQVFPPTVWDDSKLSFHAFGIVFEFLVSVSAHVPHDSSFYGNLQEYSKKVEGRLWDQWQASKENWSFSLARALAMRSQSREARQKKKVRSQVKKWSKGLMDTFLGRNVKQLVEGDVQTSILQKIGGGAGYTCGPLQGLTSLTSVLMDVEIVSIILKLIEKDIDRYQITLEQPGPFKKMDTLDSVIGGFFRDDAQLKIENRRYMRTDDVYQCLISWIQALRFLEDIVGVDVDGENVKPAEDTLAAANAEL